MTTRCSELTVFVKGLKEPAKIIVKEGVVPFMLVGALAVNFGIAFLPDIYDTQTCDLALAKMPDNSTVNLLKATFIYDDGIFTFITAGSVAGILYPTLRMAYRNVTECIGINYPSEKFSKSLNTASAEIQNALSTVILLKMTPLPAAAVYCLLPLAGIPLIRLGLRNQFKEYKKPISYEKLRQIFPDSLKTAVTIGSLEAIFSGIESSAAYQAFAYFLFDTFYDSVHVDDYPYQIPILMGVTGITSLLGVLCTYKEKPYQTNRAISETLGNFYLINMLIISILFCLDPSLENMDTFMTVSLLPVLGVSAFSMLISTLHTLFIASDEKDESEDHPSPRVEEVIEDVLDVGEGPVQTQLPAPERIIHGTPPGFFSRRFSRISGDDNISSVPTLIKTSGGEDS